LQPWTVVVGLYNLPVNASWHIPSSLFNVIADEVLRQCDPQDGLVDGIISDPRRCDFRIEALLCGSPDVNASTCLTPPQLDTLYKIYNDWVEANQTFEFPNLELGSEQQWPVLLGLPAPNPLGTDYVQYLMQLGPQWQWQDWNPSIVQLSDELNPGNCTITNFDFGAFQKKGGKLLSYHGWADGLIPPRSSRYLYNHVQRTMQPQGVNLDDFYRFFFVPGMQ
jgi:feruloyl esterase